jgi:hypothetical protein
MCSQRNKDLAQRCRIEFNAEVMRINEILKHSTVVHRDLVAPAQQKQIMYL